MHQLRFLVYYFRCPLDFKQFMWGKILKSGLVGFIKNMIFNEIHENSIEVNTVRLDNVEYNFMF